MHEVTEKLTGRITDLTIRALKPAVRTRYVLPDGLVLRVSAEGKTKSWTVVYYSPQSGKRRRLSLGRYPGVGLSAARAKAATARLAVEAGSDPGADSSAPAGSSVKTIAARWLDGKCQKRKGGPARPATITQYERCLRLYLLPEIGSADAATLTRTDAQRALDRAYKAGGVAGNRALATLRRLMNYAATEELIEDTPSWASGPRRIIERHTENPRERVLDEDELTQVWNTLDLLELHPLTVLALKLELVTGQRKCEVVTAAWGQVSDTRWIIPATVAKNGSTQAVPLTSLALDILDQAREHAETEGIVSRWVFPSPRDRAKHLGVDTVTQAVRRNRSRLGDWRPHDLRASLASGLDQLGFSERDFKLVLNHRGRVSATDHYLRRETESRKRRALEAWDERLRKALGDI